MVKIGVLALQGAVREHVEMLTAPDVEVVEVKLVEQLKELDGIVFPGGESTTIRRLIDRNGFFAALQAFAAEKKPVFGTCAGLILMATTLAGQKEAHLRLMDMVVERNAFGRQRESFETNLMVHEVGDDVRAVFIRAPLILEVGEEVDVLSKFNGEIVAARQGHLLACSFHPELTNDRRFHDYFVRIVKEAKVEREGNE